VEVKDRAHKELLAKGHLTTTQTGELDAAFGNGGALAWLQKLIEFAKNNPQLLAWIMSLFGGSLPTA
jgi:hypothetical protein